MDLPKILLTGLVFLFLFGFSSSFWTVGPWDTKTPREKPNKPKKTKKTILNGLTQDSSHRIVFFVSFWFSLTFWTYGKVEMKKGKKHEKTKDAKTQRSQRPFLKKKYLFQNHFWYLHVFTVLQFFLHPQLWKFHLNRIRFAYWKPESLHQTFSRTRLLRWSGEALHNSPHSPPNKQLLELLQFCVWFPLQIAGFLRGLSFSSSSMLCCYTSGSGMFWSFQTE